MLDTLVAKIYSQPASAFHERKSVQQSRAWSANSDVASGAAVPFVPDREATSTSVSRNTHGSAIISSSHPRCTRFGAADAANDVDVRSCEATFPDT